LLDVNRKQIKRQQTMQNEIAERHQRKGKTRWTHGEWRYQELPELLENRRYFTEGLVPIARRYPYRFG
jgi:hypothetical protein